MSNRSKESPKDQHKLHGSQPTSLPSEQQQTIDKFWRIQEDIENTMNLNNHVLPMSCVAKILRDNHGDMMMSSEMPTFMTKLLEIFIQELSVRAWMCASSHGRFTILDTDIAEAIKSVESYVFLNDVLQRHGITLDQVSTSSSASQESHLLASPTALVRNSPMPHVNSKIVEDKPVLTTSTDPGSLELKYDQDLNKTSTITNGSIVENK